MSIECPIQIKCFCDSYLTGANTKSIATALEIEEELI